MKRKKILFIKLNPLRDILYLLPTINNLKEKNKESYISFLVSHTCQEILEEHPSLNELIPLTQCQFRNNPLKYLKEIIELIQHLKKEKFDLIIDIHGGLKGFFLSLIPKAEKKIKLSPLLLTKILYGFYNEIITAPNNKNRLNFYKILASHLDISTKKTLFNLYISSQDKEYMEKIFMQNAIKKNDKLIGLAPAIHKNGSPGWELSLFAPLIEKLLKQNFKIFIIGNHGDTSLLQELSVDKKKLMFFSDNISLKQKCYLLKKSMILIGNDNEWLDLSLLMGTKTLLIAQENSCPEREYFKTLFSRLPKNTSPPEIIASLA